MKKVCKMGLESIWINNADGAVRMCGWTNYFIGNLTQSSIEELWHGERAEEFRQSMLDGSYRYCSSGKCPYCANNTKDDLMVDYIVPEYPKFCSLSYEWACNYICKFCRSERYIPEANEKEKLRIIERELNKFINQLETLTANGAGELFCSPSIINILKNVECEKDTKIELESNGSLFNEKNWREISNLAKYDLKVYITVHSFNENTYQFLSGTKLPISNIIHNLHFIQKLRKKEAINYFEIAVVVCERNFREIPDFVRKCLEFEPDSIRLRFFEPYGVKNRAIEWFYDIRNPYHPYYEEFVKMMEDPILSNPKVWKWQGTTLSELGEHPYFVEQKKVKILNTLMTSVNVEKNIKTFLQEQQINKLALYGYGYVGQAFAAFLDLNHIDISAILDSYVENSCHLGNREVLKPCREDINRYDIIVITSAACIEIKDRLLDLEYKGYIISIEEFIEKITCH